LQVSISKTRLSFYSSVPKLISREAGVSELYSTRLLFSTTPFRLLTVSFYNPSARTTQKTQPLLLTRRVYWSVISQWTSFCYMCTFSGNVLTESFPSNWYTLQVIFSISRCITKHCLETNHHHILSNPYLLTIHDCLFISFRFYYLCSSNEIVGSVT
jgi:hypothetical protein